MAGDDDEIQRPSGQRVSDRLRSAVKVAVDVAVDTRRARSLLGTKLVMVGLTLACLAGGLDYFQQADRIHQVVSGFARDTGHTAVADAIERVDREVDTIKLHWRERMARDWPRVYAHTPLVMLLSGIAFLSAGLWVKLHIPGLPPGQPLRDVGAAVIAPGALGLVAFLGISWRGAYVLRATPRMFLAKVWSGEFSRQDVIELSLRYAPWAWKDVGGTFLMGLGLIALSFLALFFRRRMTSPRWHLPTEILMRTSFWAGALALLYYGAVTVIAIVSYGGALRVVTWAWKVDRMAFMVTLTFMAFGLGLWRSGVVALRRERRSAEPEPAAA